MKKLVFLLLPFGFLACKKEQAPSNTPFTTNQMIGNFKTDGIDDIRKFIDYSANNGIGPGCFNIRESCHPVDIDVTGLSEEYQEFNEAMENNEIAGYFLGDEWSTLFPDFVESEYAEVLAELQSGNCSVSIATNNGMVYYAFYTPESATVPMYVLPIAL